MMVPPGATPCVVYQYENWKVKTWKMGRTSFCVSMAGNELSNSNSSFPPPPPRRSSSSPSSTKAALENWFASSPRRAFSRLRKSSPVAVSKPGVPWGVDCAAPYQY